MSDHINEAKAPKPGGKLAGVFGSIFLFISLALFTASFISGLSILIAGILLLPPTRKWIEEKTGKHIDRKILGGSIVALIIVMAVAMPNDATTSNEVAAQPAATNEAVQEPVNTNTAPVVEEKKPEEAPVAPAPEPTPPPAPEPEVQAPAEAPMSDKLWSALDNSIKKREGYDIKWNEGEGIVTVTYNAKDFWDETSLVRGGYTSLVKYGREAFKIDGVKDVEVEIYTELIDSMGKQSNERVMGVQMTKDVFQQFNWDNLNYSPIYSQMQSSAVYHYIHPAIMKNMNKDKLHLAI